MLLYDYPKYVIVIGPTCVTWYVQILTFDRCSNQKYWSILPAADFWSKRYIRHINYIFCAA